MLTFFEEKTSSIMGNSPTNGEKTSTEEYHDNEYFPQTSLFNGLNRKQNTPGLLFFAGTDKASVITEILEERGWSRTKDRSVTSFTIKWCLAHQVDWNQFQEGKQLINNIPGQLTFSDKINLWYTIRDYLGNRRSVDGNHIQTFLPMTFILDEESEIAGFLRSYKKNVRSWICKPRYSYAGRGIYILSGNGDLNSIFKFKVGSNNRLQYEPRLPGYLMQEYIARPLLIKNRKFDIRVHWLVAWTKPLLVFYNHKASVVRLSLNLYREYDFDRATHLTNLSVQENHCRYAFDQESTGMSIGQLNHYFNQCFRPFYPKMCQDWVMTVMQERMQTIIRHVVRASKDKLSRSAGQFGLYGCDFLLDENFRIWLLEINDNPGVGWGNPRLNTATKPLFEETLDIVFECFEKYNKNQPILPIQCLQNYELIYNEDDDAERLVRDDNQIFSERLAIRYARKESLSRTANRRLLPRVNSSRTPSNQNEHSIDIQNSPTINSRHSDIIILPSINITNSNSPVIDMLRPQSSMGHSIILNPPILATTPVSFSPVDTKSVTPPICATTPVSLSLADARPFNPSMTNSTPLSFSTMTTTTPFTSMIVDRTEDTTEPIESLRHDDDIELEQLMKPKQPIIFSKSKPVVSAVSTTNRPVIRISKTSIKRTLSVTNNVGIHRKKRIDLTPIIIDNRRYIHRHGITPSCTETSNKKDKLITNTNILPDDQQEKIEKQDDQSVPIVSPIVNSPELFSTD